MRKLAILTSHPIQYNAPLFRLLAQNSSFAVKVFYTLGKESSGFVDPGFKKTISWDVPLLKGYDYTFVKNTSSNPTTSAFNGIINPTLIKEIEDFGATHILIYGWSFQSHLKVLRHFRGKVKLLFRGDSTLLDEKPGIKTIARRIVLRWVYKHIDVALYVGTNNKQYYLKHAVPEHKLVFAPHAIDNDRFSQDSYYQKALELKQQLNIALDKKVFLFAGKFERKKNPLLLVEAFLKLNAKDTVLVMVGNGAFETELKALAQGCERIKFLPFQNQSVMPAFYRVGDILVLPSKGPGETWGLCMNEAMACGLGIVASDKVGGAKDLIENDSNGRIFKSGNLNFLTEALAALAQLTKEQLKDMGRQSQAKVSDWSYQNTASAIKNCVLD
ncbi:glycosyltransferase family 4 protein [Pontibacter populi]|uniref:Glycosyltransferase family 4 protein n=1 Tax=Pontibacter populi TaxID=890055 RepID=A0ABV1RV95_9BACT